MDIIFLLKGIIIGYMASIPLGPIGVLCVQRTINTKFRSGFISALGATCADTIFAIIAMFFISLVSTFLNEKMVIISVVGGAIMMTIGTTIFTTKITPGKLRKNRNKSNMGIKFFASTFLLTLANPAFIFIFVGLFASFNITNEHLDMHNAMLTIFGVTVGSALWWLTLTSIVNLFRNKFRPRHLITINKIAGSLIFILGISAILLALLDSSELKNII